jgi:ribonuclease HI
MTQKLIIHTDGGARGNPGPAAIGVVIEKEGKLLRQFGKRIGEATNNVAEYTAVVEALQYLLNSHVTCSLSRVTFYLDSKLVVEQLNGRFKIKDMKLRELSLKIKILEQEVGGVITYSAVPREKNKQADLLVNQALDQQ